MARSVLLPACVLLAGMLMSGPAAAAGSPNADPSPAGQPAEGPESVPVRGWLGVYWENPSEAVRAALGIEHGVLVAEVADESPAARAGVRKGDVILELDGSKATDGSVLRRLVRDRPGCAVKLTVMRRGETVDLNPALGSRSRSERMPWVGWSGDAARLAGRALRRVGDGQLPEEVRARILGPDEQLEDIDELRNRLKALLVQLRREGDELRREFRAGAVE